MTSRMPAIAALGLTCLTLLTSGCAGTTAGTAMPAGPAPAVTAENLAEVLLPAGDVAAALSVSDPVAQSGSDPVAQSGSDPVAPSGTDMVVTREVTAPWDDSWHGTESTGCLAVAGAAQRDVYAGSGWTAVRGQVLREPPTARSWSHFATQAAVLFASPQAAGEFFARSRDTWAACSNRELTYAQQLAPEQLWTIGPVGVANGVLTVARSQRSPQNWSCQRALTVHGSVAVDVEACSLAGPTAAAATIARDTADRMGPA